VNHAVRIAPCLLVSFALACSSSHPTTSNGSTPPASTADAGFVPFAPGPTTFSMTGGTIAGSSESFNCTYVQMPSTAGFIIGGQHEYTPGSHHLLLYRTTLTSIPAGEGSPNIGDCYGANATYMNTITGAVYAAQTPTGEFTLPAGVGIPYAANEVLLFQVHYLDATATPLHPEIYVRLTTQTTPVQQNAGILLFYAPFIYVPAGGMAIASHRCPITQNITLLSQSSHYHARGVNYQAYLDTSPSSPTTTPIYTSNSWESPPIQTETMQISAGSDIRYYCDYDNTTGTTDFIQGQSALTNEMCMFGGIYYPAMSTDDEECYNGDLYGTGTTSCTDTLTCLAACPPNDGTGPLGLPNFNECYQKCWVESCPNASDAIAAAGTCIETSCSTQCATQGSACTTCVAANCASQYEACQNVACGTPPTAPPE
jgi:hypothetical protein